MLQTWTDAFEFLVNQEVASKKRVKSIYDDAMGMSSASSCAIYFMSLINNNYSAKDEESSFIYVICLLHLFLSKTTMQLSIYNIESLLALSVSLYDKTMNDYPLGTCFWAGQLCCTKELMLQRELYFFAAIGYSTTIRKEACDEMHSMLSRTYNDFVIPKMTTEVMLLLSESDVDNLHIDYGNSHTGDGNLHTGDGNSHTDEMDDIPSCGPYEEMLLCYEKVLW